MRIAYLSLHWPRAISSSIGKKILNQISFWKKAGNEVEFFSHLHNGKEKNQLLDGKKAIYAIKPFFWKTEQNRIQAAKEILRKIEGYKPDLIYLRWGMYVHPLSQLSKIAPMIVEINTNDKKEHRRLDIFLHLYNTATRGIFLVNADGHVYTSAEFAALDIFSKYQKPYRIISNGINLSSIHPFHAPHNDTPHLLFVGTPGMEWHGVEKLVTFAEKYPDVIVDLVGYDFIHGLSIPKNMVLHGYLSGQAYQNVLKKADAAIGTLALYKKEMQEASPLKIRDCAARGIPCILPYKDTDLYDLTCDQILQIPNAPDNIQTHGEDMHRFLFKMRGQRIPRDIIADRISSEKKESDRLSFFSMVIDQKKA